jgi:DNA-binding beta-propeller fold protein YncE
MRSQLAALVALTVLLGSCSSTSPSQDGPTAVGIDVIPDSTLLHPGDTLQLTVTVLDSVSQPIDDAPVAFVSRHPSVATVTATGKVTAVAPGRDTIVIVSGAAKGTVIIDVRAKAVAIDVTPDSAELTPGDTIQLTVIVRDSLGLPIVGAPVSFVSRHPSVATVSSTGEVIAEAYGRDTIDVLSGEAEGIVIIDVEPVAVEIQVTPSGATLAVGDTLHLGVTVLDAFGDPIGDAPVVFTSRHPSIATVSVTGKVTAEAYGRDTIDVVSGELAETAIIDVVPPWVTVAGRPFGIAVSSLGQVYVTRQDDNALTRILLGPDTVAGTVAVGADPGDVVFNAAGTVAYVTNFNGHSVSRVDVGSATQTDVAGVGAAAFHVRMSASGTTIFVASNNGFLYTLDATTLARIDSVAIDGAPNGLAIKGDTLAYVSSTATGHVTEIDLQGDTVRRVFDVGGVPQDVVLSAAGSTLFVANEAGRLDIVSLGAGTVGTPISNLPGAFGLARTVAGDTLYLTSLDGKVRKIDGTSKTVLFTIRVGGMPRRVAVAADGTVVVANEADQVNIIRE